MFPTVVEVPEAVNGLNVTELTVTLVPDPKLAEAKSDPVVTTSLLAVPVMFCAVDQLIVAAFAGGAAIARTTAVIAAMMAAANELRIFMKQILF
jgi:hypothetical protein